jgi:hypothetical protein
MVNQTLLRAAGKHLDVLGKLADQTCEELAYHLERANDDPGHVAHVKESAAKLKHAGEKMIAAAAKAKALAERAG